jgi:hypothetical protein
MKKIFLTLSLAILAVSCNEDFLETAPTETISTPPAEYKLNGLYVMMINTGTGGTTAHEDFGQKGYDIYSDMLSGDLALARNAYNRYLRLANLSATVDFTRNENYQPWRYYYRLIGGANDIITELGGNDAVPEGNNKAIMGQAKAIRAYAYFYLMQFFNQTYNPSADAIPVYTVANQAVQPKSKQSEVYSLIISDLTSSISLLDGFSRANKGYIDGDVAKGILAYTYAAMGENAKAAEVSLDIMNNSGIPVTTNAEALGGFNTLDSSPSWMWGFDLTNDNGLDLISWWGQMDMYTYSYQSVGDYKTADQGLMLKLAERTDDIRNNQFTGTFGGFKYFPTGKFYNGAKVIQGARNVTDDYVYMRVDEFYLLAAETLAKSGSEAQAKTILKNYLGTQAKRITNVSYIDALSGTALQNEIYLQTRIEFWGEGKSYLAMKRNKATITRGANHQFFPNTSYNYDDTKLTFKIPQSEVQNNPYID